MHRFVIFYKTKTYQFVIKSMEKNILDSKCSTGLKGGKRINLETQNIINAIPIGIHMYHLENDDRLIFDGANPAANEILGVDNSIFIGKTIEEAFPALTETDIPARYREAASSGKSFRTEDVYYNEGKITGAFEVHAFQIEPGRMAAFFSDISERKRSEEEIKFQNSLMRTQQEATEDGILIVDRTGNILSYNKKFVSIWKIPENLLISGFDYPVLNFVTDSVVDSENFINKVKYLYSNENESSRDILNLKDGRILERYSSPVIADDMTYYGRVWYFHDITAEKNAEKLIKQNEAEFRGLFEAIPTGAVMLVNRKYKRVSSRYCKMTGYTPEELIGQPTRMLYPDEETDYRVGKELYETMKMEGIGKCDARIKRKDGSILDVMIYALPINPDDYSKGVAAILEDLTLQKKAEAERERFREELVQSQKMESIGKLAGGIAHDFNNLLTAIIGNAELALRVTPETERIHSKLNIIKQAAQSAAELVGQLLAFSRKQIIDPKVINLNISIESMHKMLERIIGENLKLCFNLQKNINNIKVDLTQMQQIIINLMVNARDAMPDGGVVTVETSNVVLDDSFSGRHDYSVRGDHVMLAISDSGTGMSNETMEHLFEPFFTTKELGKGTGLGLSTVYGAVKQNSGTINVYSEPGKGTSFKIYFPVVSEDVSEIYTYENDELSAGTESILLVEDNPFVIQFSENILQSLGYEVTSAQSGEEALEILENNKKHFDLLITDVVLPGINGRALAEKVIKIAPDIKVLFNSGYTENTIVAHGVLDRGLNFISKPFSAFDLANKIREVLGKD